MANTIKIKRGSGSDPAASDMVLGEPVLRTDTAELFFKKDDGSVAKVSGGGGGPDFKYLALRNAANNGAASFPNADFTLVTSGTTSAIIPTAANTLLVSVNGVIQKPNTGTSTPSQGFALSGSTIKFGANISAAPDFILYQESGGIGEPSDETVSEEKLKVSNSPVNGYFLSAQSGNTGGLTWAAPVATSCTGNSATATALATARTINGTSFDGTANITVTAAAGTLSGTTLNSSVVTSSLTSLGDLSGLTVTGDVVIADSIIHSGDTDTKIRFPSANKVSVETAGTEKLAILHDEIIINETGGDFNLRIEGDTDINLFKVDAGNNRVGIGTTSPAKKLHVFESGAASIRLETGDSRGQAFDILSTNGANNNTGTLSIRNESNQTFVDFASNEGSPCTKIYNAGTEKLRIDSSGKVGIGESSPDAMIHIKSSANVLGVFESTDADALIEFKDNGTSDTILVGALGGDDLLLRSDAGNIIFNLGNNSEKARFDSNGRLLLGSGAIALPKGSGAGSFDLDNGNITMCIGGNSNSTGRTNSTNKINRVTSPHYTNAEEPVALLSSFNISGSNTISYGGGSSQTNAATRHIFYTAANTTTTTGTERMRIDSSGKVGIGTTSPDQTLHVLKGSAGTVDSASQTVLTLENNVSAHLQFLVPNNMSNQIRFGDPQNTNAGFINYNHGQNKMSFATTDSSERLIIDSSGNVGINETSPQQTLHVHNDTAYQGILVNGNGAPRVGFARSTTTTGEWSVGIDGTNGNDFVINNSNDNSNRKLILSSTGVTSAGALTAGGSCTAFDNFIVGTAGKGLSFAVASNLSGMTSETLNDYEEGTFTPTNSTVGVQSSYTYGYYQKVGNWVSVQFGVRFNNNGSAIATHIDGLPFNMAPDQNSTNTNSFAIGYHNGNHIQFALGNSGDRVFVYDKNGNTVQLTHMDNDYIRIFGTYKTS